MRAGDVVRDGAADTLESDEVVAAAVEGVELIEAALLRVEAARGGDLEAPRVGVRREDGDLFRGHVREALAQGGNPLLRVAEVPDARFLGVGLPVRASLSFVGTR